MSKARQEVLSALRSGNLGRFKEQLVKLKWNGFEPGKEPVYEKSGDTLIHVIARDGRPEDLDHVVDVFGLEAVDLDSPNIKDFKRPLHEAAQFGRVQLAHKLVELSCQKGKPLDINCIKRADWTPLMLAATKSGPNHLNTIRFLLENKGDTMMKNKDGWNSFHLAVREGDIQIVGQLLEVEPDCWKTISNNGRTPSHTAALHGRLEVTKLLEEGGMVPDVRKDSCGVTPFCDAVKSGNLMVIEHIGTRHPEDLATTDVMGRSPLDTAACLGNVDVVEYLISEMDLDPLASLETGMTPLHWAALEGHAPVARLLVEKFGLNPDKTDKLGRNPTYLAVTAGKVDAAEYLIQKTRTFNINLLSLNIVQSHPLMMKMIKETFESKWNIKLHYP